MKEIREYVSRESYERLQEYICLLLKWNKSINLISSKTVNDVMRRHILDSLQLLKFIDSKDITVLDFGSGAGFPGVILSISGIKKVILIESDERKSAFLLQASKLSEGNVEIINDRIETLSNLKCDIITSRAFANLSKIFELGNKFSVSDKYLLHKGDKYYDEIEGTRKEWLFDINIHDSITSGSGKIIEVKNLVQIL